MLVVCKFGDLDGGFLIVTPYMIYYIHIIIDYLKMWMHLYQPTLIFWLTQITQNSTIGNGMTLSDYVQNIIYDEIR